MRYKLFFALFFGMSGLVFGQGHNPVFPGWYADPEGTVFDNTFWIYPTYSAPYDKQVFFDAFSSKDLVEWKKHEHILDTSSVKWARRAIDCEKR